MRLLTLCLFLIVGCAKPTEPTSKPAEPSALSKLSKEELRDKAKVAFEKWQKTCEQLDRATDKRDRKMLADMILIQMRQLDDLIDEAERRAQGDVEKMKLIRDQRDLMRVIKKRLEDESTNANRSR